MSSSGYMLRRDQALARRGDTPCDCGHRLADHRELQPSHEIRDGAIVTIAHPDYEPGAFHCEIDGCDCVRHD